jgi:hypothetical protein
MLAIFEVTLSKAFQDKLPEQITMINLRECHIKAEKTLTLWQLPVSANH